jgi:hypothetical protein
MQDTQDQQQMQQDPSPGSPEMPSVQQGPAAAAAGAGSAGSRPTEPVHHQPPEQQQQVSVQAHVSSRVDSCVLGPAFAQQQTPVSVGVPQPGTPAAAQGSSLLRRGADLLVLLQSGWVSRPRRLQAGCSLQVQRTLTTASCS